MAFAYRIAKNLKIKDKTIIKGLNKFKGLPHRQEIVFSNKKLLCINDSKATSFDACLQSLSNYNKIYWIVGGLPKYRDRFYLKNVKKKLKLGYFTSGNELSNLSEKLIGSQINNSNQYTLYTLLNRNYLDVLEGLQQSNKFGCNLIKIANKHQNLLL